MQLIEAALAFAITMLALSLIVSSFVEIIHRVFSMREDGLKYVLGQMLDQVIDKHLRTAISARVQVDPNVTDKSAKITELLDQARKGFVERMSANRAPMGLTTNATPTDASTATADGTSTSWLSKIPLWNGRTLASMTPAEFMERLGSMENVGQAIAEANAAAQTAAVKAGATAADVVNVVHKDIAQKFEAFGKEASVYFEGRARLLSVVVAIALAFLAHVDAVDLFKTYLRDPNARAKVIEQSEAVTARYKAATAAAEAVKNVVPTPADATPAVKEQLAQIRKDWEAAIGSVETTVAQYADVGVPLGWTPERIKNAKMTRPWVWTCKDPNKSEGEGLESLWKDCDKNKWQKEIWFQLPTAPGVVLYLFLGGLLVGLGAPFWYNAVTGLTNLRNSARGTTSSDAQTRAGVLAAAGAGTVQPATPVDAFKIANAARPTG
jgi:hypothetical protein